MANIPRFAPFLPPGGGVDWAFRQYAHRWAELNVQGAPSPGLVQELWGTLGETDAVAVVDSCEDRGLLAWAADRAAGRDQLRSALLRNPNLPLESVMVLLRGTFTRVDVEALVLVRDPREVALLLLDVDPFRRQVETWRSEQRVARLLGAGAAAGARDGFLREAAATVADEHLPELLRGVLLTDPEQQRTPIADILDVVEDCDGLAHDPGAQSIWEALATHAAATGDDADLRRVLGATAGPAARSVLLARGRIGVADAVAGLNPALVATVLVRVGEERPLTAAEALAGVDAGIGPEILHTLNLDPAAAAELAGHDDAATAGAAVWQVAADSRLARALSTSDECRRWSGRHLWRLGRVWGRLSNRARHAVFAALPASAVLEIGAGEMRTWLITDGPPEALAGVSFRRDEIKMLLERIRATPHPGLAWKVAAAAERPRERVAAAAVALRSSAPGGEADRDAQLRAWARRSSSGEIVALWSQLDPPTRRSVGQVLVSGLRGGDESSWVARIVGDLALRWQQAPTEVQEAAGMWLARQVRDDPAVWEMIWALYPEWEGTLVELVTAARYA